MFKKQAFSLVELLIGILIFSLAVLPLVWVGQKQTSSAFSAGKHMMAGQIAASFMDNMLKRPFEELKVLSLNSHSSGGAPGEINGDVLEFHDDMPSDMIAEGKELFNLRDLMNNLSESSENSNHSAKDNIESTFNDFKYEIFLDYLDDNGYEIIEINVKVSYNSYSDTYVELRAIKFGEKRSD